MPKLVLHASLSLHKLKLAQGRPHMVEAPSAETSAPKTTKLEKSKRDSAISTVGEMLIICYNSQDFRRDCHLLT